MLYYVSIMIFCKYENVLFLVVFCIFQITNDFQAHYKLTFTQAE